MESCWVAVRKNAKSPKVCSSPASWSLPRSKRDFHCLKEYLDSTVLLKQGCDVKVWASPHFQRVFWAQTCSLFLSSPRYTLSFLLTWLSSSVLQRFWQQTIPKSRGRAWNQRCFVGHTPTHPERVTWPGTNPRWQKGCGTWRPLSCRSRRELTAAWWVGGMRWGRRVGDVTEGEASVLVSASQFLSSVCFLSGKGQTFLV